jgi:hypothetical protein
MDAPLPFERQFETVVGSEFGLEPRPDSVTVPSPPIAPVTLP